MDISDFKNIIWDYTRKINESTNNIIYPICDKCGLTMLQVRILVELCADEAHTIGSLGASMNIAGANMSAMCKKLEKMGLLKRYRDKNDERVVKVALTEKGNDIVIHVDRVLSEKILKNIGDETEETFNNIIIGLKKLNDLLQKISSNEN